MFKRDPGLGLSLVPSSEGGAKTDGKLEIPVTLQIQFVIQPIYFHFSQRKYFPSPEIYFKSHMNKKVPPGIT